MVKNLWDRIDFFCMNNHAEPVKMEIQYGGKTPFYACPKWYSENREENERACPNVMSLNDCEDLVLKFSKIISQSDEMCDQTDYTNYQYDYLGPRAKIRVKVLKYTDTKIHLGILNLTKCNK